MSYEGYEQHICKNGHRFNNRDIYYMGECPARCPYCKAESAFMNCVDETNGPPIGKIEESEWEKFLIEPEKIDTCPHCLRSNMTEQARYRIPTEEESKAIKRMTWDDISY